MPEGSMPPVIGPDHNKAPLIEVMKELNAGLEVDLPREFAAAIARTDELMEGFTRAPATIETAEQAGKVATFVAQISKCVNEADALRRALVGEPLSMQRSINGYSDKNIFDKLDTPKGTTGIKQILLQRLTIYERKIEEQERQRRLEAERLAREEAERRRREAEEIERKARQEAAERQRKIDEERAKAKSIEDLERAEREELLAKEKAAQREQEVKLAADRARQAEADALAREKAATAKAADMSTVRGDYGGHSSLRTEWMGEILDRAALDLEMLRSHIPAEALDQAVRSFIKAGGRKLKGARIYEHTRAVVRG